MGVGGSLDVISDTVRRAPVFMQKAGLEWLYRLLTQPSRFKRMSVLPLFLIEIIAYRLFPRKITSYINTSEVSSSLPELFFILKTILKKRRSEDMKFKPYSLITFK